MVRQKRTYRALERAELRVSGLKAIDPSMDFGENRSLQNITQVIEEYRNEINTYNTALTTIDSSMGKMDEFEKVLNDLIEKMLIGVAFKYGKDSREYEMAGAVRKSDRIRKSQATRLKNSDQKANQNNS
ncbi:hypothetical protein A6S26_11870 [Nostoc sp. ATCC 43529]|nr:hypothetical protein A6S26_11870 [Nostoc sp. ATCC 43529]